MKFNAIVMMLCLAVLTVACDDTGVDVRQSFTFPDSDVSFNGHVKPFFYQSCAVSGCHDAFSKAGDLALETYNDLFQRPGIVIPGDSTRSLLIQVLSRRSPHRRTQYFLEVTAIQMHGVAVWVQEGALRN